MSKSTTDIHQTFIQFVSDFIVKNKQDRLLLFYQNPKNWWKIKDEFHTSNLFDSKKLIEITPNEQFAAPIYLTLKSLGAKDHCFSLLDYLADEPFECQLESKLAAVVGMLTETIIYCPVSRTGYFEGGHAKDRYILRY